MLIRGEQQGDRYGNEGNDSQTQSQLSPRAWLWVLLLVDQGSRAGLTATVLFSDACGEHTTAATPASLHPGLRMYGMQSASMLSARHAGTWCIDSA